MSFEAVIVSSKGRALQIEKSGENGRLDSNKNRRCRVNLADFPMDALRYLCQNYIEAI
jgi:hypothetical protein